MSDPKVEEIRANAAAGKFLRDSEGRYLLTKLEEAEIHAATMSDLASVRGQARAAAEERERILLAGVREAQSRLVRGIKVPWNEADGGWGDIEGAVELLSRLLPSTPTEEGKNNER